MTSQTTTTTTVAMMMVLAMALAMGSVESLTTGTVHRLPCPESPHAPKKDAFEPIATYGTVTLVDRLAYVTASRDMRVNAILCERSNKKLCLPVSCEVGAGSVCAIQSPSGAGFDAASSRCIQSATTKYFDGMMHHERSQAHQMHGDTWMEHCVCTIKTNNWILNSRTDESQQPTLSEHQHRVSNQDQQQQPTPSEHQHRVTDQ